MWWLHQQHWPGTSQYWEQYGPVNTGPSALGPVSIVLGPVNIGTSQYQKQSILSTINTGTSHWDQLYNMRPINVTILGPDNIGAMLGPVILSVRPDNTETGTCGTGGQLEPITLG